MTRRTWLSAVIGLYLVAASAACTPEVGSEKWCQMMKDKPTGDWTANQAADFAKHCIIR